ncbi:hypothetical protein [Sulfurimonas sp.]|uniref:hypothetical protein n=1 Tax=Sulfurimonas sp. TaxID=2022749 RepID=UPI0026067386|nr:hypothetical protein [Sulfurimonas sp.]MDD3451660.1 hypothetical protein [Sulfurimonas sp.]
MTISAALLLASCAKVDGANPSQNQALNAISGKKESDNSGFMQQKLDRWLKEEWSPITEGTTPPNGETSVKIVPKENGTSELIDAKTGVLLKKMDKEETKREQELQAKYQDEERPFTLQEYIDKMERYNSRVSSDEKNSHVGKINAMPVIGTATK